MTKIKNELVIVKNSSDTMLIDARLLHQQLQITTRFNDWIQRRIQEYGFEDGADFYSILSKSIFGRKPTDYHLTMDMAKELAMLERNEVGKHIRQYFIAVEKEARAMSGNTGTIPAGVKHRTINGRKVYPYLQLAEKLGYTSGGSLYSRCKRYPNHFITFDRLKHVSEEMACLMAMAKGVTRQRETIKALPPLLPANFATPIQIAGGGLW